MQVLTKNVFLVFSDHTLFEKTIQRKNKKSVLIDAIAIRKKIIEESYKEDDAIEIINYNIRKRINQFKNCKTSSFIYYYVNFLDDNVINTLKHLFKTPNYEINFHLLAEDKYVDTISDKIKLSFNSVQLLHPTHK